MGHVTKEEYLRLVEQYANEQYGSDVSDEYTISEDAWIPAVSEIKEKMAKALNSRSGCVDLTSVRKDKIREALYKCSTVKIGAFLIKIDEYWGEPDKYGKGDNLNMDLSIWEERYRTPSGNPCRMTYRMNLHQDSRFTARPWLPLFNKSGTAYQVPVDTVVEIVKWMQAIKKMSAFL